MLQILCMSVHVMSLTNDAFWFFQFFTKALFSESLNAKDDANFDSDLDMSIER